MGLDITAYSHLTYVGHHPVERPDNNGLCHLRYDADDNKFHVPAYAYDSFPHALLGIPEVKPSPYPDIVTGGCFEVTEKTESHGFQAGSYSGYNAWRGDLAERFNPYRDNGQPSPEGPFYELIWFADNEGTIGELAAVSLLADFRQREAEYRAAHLGTERGDYFVEKYAGWLRACELAADGGLIDFH